MFERFLKNQAWGKTEHWYRKATGNSLWGSKVLVEQGLEITRAGLIVLASSVETDIVQPAGSMEGGLIKGKMACASTCVSYFHPPNSCYNVEQFSSSPYVSFKLLFQQWSSEWASPSKSVCGIFEEMPGKPAASMSFSQNPHWFLQPEDMRTPPAATGSLDWGAWQGADTPCFSRGCILPVFICHLWLVSAHQSWCGIFCNLVIL